EPGKYEGLVDACAKSGITVSVIGLGTDKDKDANLLRDIAKRGKGRIFFSDKAEELPRLFAQDTFVVARNTFLDEPTRIVNTAGLTTIAGKMFSQPPSIGGYNLCYLRPQANLATVTTDEYKAPVAASWQAGAGRVLCFTGEADGQYVGQLARWKEVGDYFTSLARWTAGFSTQSSKDYLITQEVKNGVNTVQVHLDPERKEDPFRGVPKVSILKSRPGGTPVAVETTMRWAGADTLTLEVPLEGDETTVTTVTVPDAKPMSLPPVCLTYSPEVRP